MDISGGGQYADMSENFLKFKEIDAGFRKMRGIAAVAQRMARNLFYADLFHNGFHSKSIEF